MRLIRVGLAALLALAVSASVPAFAQHDHDKDDKDKKHDRGDDRGGPGNHGKGHAYGHEKHEEHDWHHEHDTHYVRYEQHEGHRRIPEEHFRAHFGHEHRFVIERPVIVAGHPRFQYDGYWFAIARPLPPGWRYTDQVYVDYVDNNYYVLSPVHPGVRISINIL